VVNGTKKEYVILIGESEEDAVGYTVKAVNKVEAIKEFTLKWPDINPEQIIDVEKLDKFPELSKEELQELIDKGEITDV
jgi:phenylacetate-coenzyme A ligase PaaK-like adenylate-forming protein